MDIIDNLTNEEISKRFSNQFDLVNYAIALAVEMIHTGREPRVKLNTENPALLILEEIAEGKDQLIEECKKDNISIEKTELAVDQIEVNVSVDQKKISFEDEEEAQEVLSD